MTPAKKPEPRDERTSETDDASFEEHLEAVAEAVRSLEQGAVPLEDSIDIYAEAMRRLAACRKVLDRAEARLEIVRREVDGELETEALDSE